MSKKKKGKHWDDGTKLMYCIVIVSFPVLFQSLDYELSIFFGVHRRST